MACYSLSERDLVRLDSASDAGATGANGDRAHRRHSVAGWSHPLTTG